MQALMRAIYPPHCIGCRTIVDSEGGLCGPCYRDTPFITGPICTRCGTPLPGEEAAQGDNCDDCTVTARPWTEGRAALMYGGKARSLVLGLKHGDRTELAAPAARWMATAGRDVIERADVIAPIPLHWLRFVRRRQNQSALLAQALAREVDLPAVPDLLFRVRRTPTQEGRSFRERFANLAEAIQVTPRFTDYISGKSVLLVDDVMTSGATFAAATEACRAAGAVDVFVLALARVVKDA
ncbi:ComF family protein [Alphaproteobacteria bacterium KMM 3653]|uniref:ComF family protein n=1 Tax=Harenicola maris TaxID=2841044 RepID=A0AAP2CQ43_9RHOB|nr:ComF family protein [Harenicola maris]